MSTITAALTSRKHEVLDRVRALAALAGGGVKVEQFGLDAPEFAYRPDSELLKVASAAYRDVIGRHYPPMSVVQVVALLEQGAKVEIEATAVIPD